MIYLMQILHMVDDIDYFEGMFIDLEYEIEEMGWTYEALIPDMLFNHFGIEMECENQLKMLVECMKQPRLIESACRVVKLKKGA